MKSSRCFSDVDRIVQGPYLRSTLDSIGLSVATCPPALAMPAASQGSRKEVRPVSRQARDCSSAAHARSPIVPSSHFPARQRPSSGSQRETLSSGNYRFRSSVGLDAFLVSCTLTNNGPDEQARLR